MLKKLLSVFNTRNDKQLKMYSKVVLQINKLEPKYEKQNDKQLQQSFQTLKDQLNNDEKKLDELLNDVFAIVREVSKRVLNMRHYDVQLIGGMVLNDNKIAEMKTGEGKTLVATLPVVLNAMSGKPVHIITVNDYLASRDANELRPLYGFLGFSVGVIVGDIDDHETRKAQYDADITYGTNNEYGFDYLRDNMTESQKDKIQRGHSFAIVDEVDSILIDEARSPLIISGATGAKNDNYVLSDKIAKSMTKGETIEPKSPEEDTITTGDFTIDEKNKNVMITDQGIEKAEKAFGVDSMYSLENAVLSHNIDQAIKANYLFNKDVDYIIREDKILIVDEFTGRVSEGRRFSEGLHQALEAKEGVAIQKESQTLADITFQNYFRLYKKLSGMTGTAQTEAAEFAQIYDLDVVSIPTNVSANRDDKNDLIYRTEKEKFEAVATKIKELNKKGQPVLVGTGSIEKSELLHDHLTKQKIKHTVLNAKQHQKEGQIIEDAGLLGSVTIATNMAGRGVDIKLPKECLQLGGLAIIGTERHESRRIDNQLRGRSGRQGDVGSSQFFLSLEDNLLRIFGSDKISSVMARLGLKDGEHIESGMVTRSVENAQKKVEAMHFESRKHLLEYDDVANKQRQTIYQYRDNLLDETYDIGSKIDENFQWYIDNLLNDANIMDGMPPEEFDIDQLNTKLKEELSIDMAQNSFDDMDYEAIHGLVSKAMSKVYNDKFAIITPEQKSEVERLMYLQVLDNYWREHLYAIDTLKTGIGLRSYNQKDPLVEYKKESYEMFLQLVSSIKHEIVRLLFTIQIRDKEEQEIEKLKHKMKEDEENQDIEYNKGQTKQSTAKKIPRNSPCPCGSGKKYKQCCGKSGPKKGVLASL
ncbi:MAG: preprotein translocase subunit SecA [Epsilonproteobacteria bacterium]|nr:MAG: preprotein translocase subunit SecA [Campylobacterota bacterium]